MNPLGYYLEEALNINLNIDALWIDETVTTKDKKFKGLIFGGLAFKYQKQPSNIELACKEATYFTDVACTSGPGTGKAPSIEKIQTIRKYLGNHLYIYYNIQISYHIIKISTEFFLKFSPKKNF